MRIDYRARPEIFQAMRALGSAVRQGPLEPSLVDLIEIRASQLNGCAHCLEMHTQDATARGESNERLNLVVAWREAPWFTERERAALLWCEQLTLLADNDVADDVYESVSSVFSDDELCALTLAVVAINGWNRFGVAFRAPVGEYVSRVNPTATK